MRHVDKKTHPTDRIGARIVYREYAEARGALIDLLGEYCSFCEMQLDASLAVEHVQPKSKVSALATSWENFLLACTNCNSTKGNRHIVLGDYVWPDRDNTVLCLQYGPGALVRVAVSLTDPTIRERTQNTINLVGLDWNPSKPKTRTAASSEGRDTASDRRWRNRQEKWYIAIDAYRDLDASIREAGNNSLAT
ncbi:MAG: hypothetical protein JWM11_7134, partial [Planctomycetaceae bacterium]|nr:hypothetical protein [Planctomycetaceae bacterium]